MRYWMSAVLGLCLGGSALADEVKLISGGTLSGIAREELGLVVVETGFGTLTVPVSAVKSIVRGKTALVAYQELVSGLGGCPQSSEVFELALWAQQQGLTRYVDSLLQWTLALDPDHARARRLLEGVTDGGCGVPARKQEERIVAESKGRKRALDPRSQANVRRTPAALEISPGYVYFGIPPMLPRRGSQHHGSGGYYPFWNGLISGY
jgi:hypothetical protein